MLYLNQVNIVGNLTKNPELKSLPSGSYVCSFSVATNYSYKKDGKKVETVEYHNLVCFGKQAEVIAQYMKKGDQIFVTGRLQTRSWEDKETGKKMYRTEIVIEEFKFGASKRAKNAPRSDGSAKDDGGVEGIDYPQDGGSLDDFNQVAKDNFPTEDINPADIPF